MHAGRAVRLLVENGVTNIETGGPERREQCEDGNRGDAGPLEFHGIEAGDRTEREPGADAEVRPSGNAFQQRVSVEHEERMGLAARHAGDIAPAATTYVSVAPRPRRTRPRAG